MPPQPAPILYRGVMISSTFTDLKDHRAALINALNHEKLKPEVMEFDSAKPVDVIESSLQMVRDASAYIGVISLKYGQTPVDPKRNPNALSITELEFNEALRLNRPILLFIMGEDHFVKKGHIEANPVNEAKLNAFRERAKQISPDSQVHRVYATFNSLEDFNIKAIHAVANLRRHLEATEVKAPPAQPPRDPDPIPTPPAFYAEPPYIGSHKFIGRAAQLEILSDWAKPADPHPVLLFDAIGGSGKSMLTWEWTTNHATQLRTDWAGRFWYSFYERGAIMADFCRRALAYITREPLDSFTKQKTPELAEKLLRHLRDRPWLLVLDGLERVLVAYHRFDAAQLTDEEASQPTDQIAGRDPCAAIRPEDDDLLRALAAAAPSKLLVTSRLMPRVLLNQANQPINGVRRSSLPGLRPPDAEALLRSCGVKGNSQEIQTYLTTHCDCHPLVTGVLAGLINSYLPDRGNFDAWQTDPAGGGQLNLADLDLVQKRNHILKAGIEALPKESRELLSILALLSEAVDYATMSALNPQTGLTKTVRDLEHRGLLQYDERTKHYDLHPVVRSVAAGALQPKERDGYGQRVVDHFSAQPHRPYDEAEMIEDVRQGVRVVRALLKMGRYKQAADVYRGSLARSLLFNLEANSEILSLLRPFFPKGWAILPSDVDNRAGSYLANDAALTLRRIGESNASLDAFGTALAADLSGKNWSGVFSLLANIANTFSAQSRRAREERTRLSALEIATLTGDNEQIFHARLSHFTKLAISGQWENAQAVWDLLDPMGRIWSRAVYLPGYAEYWYALFRFWQGDLNEKHLAHAEQLAQAGRGRQIIRWLHALRGEWHLELDEWSLAAESLHEAISMARAVGQTEPEAETQLALARFHLGQLPEPRHEAEQLANRVSSRALAELWLAIGDHARAKEHALEAYRWAWADGEPYVWRYELNKARALLEKLGVEIPNLPPYDPSKDPKIPWEDEVAAAIQKLRAEKQAAVTAAPPR